MRIFKTYGKDAIDVVRDNPYRLARDIRGIGFLSADTIARKIGIALDSPLRAQAGVDRVHRGARAHRRARVRAHVVPRKESVGPVHYYY